MSSVAGVINKCVSCVAEAYRFFVRGKVGCTGSGYRRGEVRPEYQGVAFSVKEFVEFFGGDGSYFTAEYFEVFECGGFYVFIAILVEDAMDFLLYLSFLAAFAVVDVSTPSGVWKIRCMGGPPLGYVLWLLLLCQFRFSVVTCY